MRGVQSRRPVPGIRRNCCGRHGTESCVGEGLGPNHWGGAARAARPAARASQLSGVQSGRSAPGYGRHAWNACGVGHADPPGAGDLRRPHTPRLGRGVQPRRPPLGFVQGTAWQTGRRGGEHRGWYDRPECLSLRGHTDCVLWSKRNGERFARARPNRPMLAKRLSWPNCRARNGTMPWRHGCIATRFVWTTGWRRSWKRCIVAMQRVMQCWQRWARATTPTSSAPQSRHNCARKRWRGCVPTWRRGRNESKPTRPIGRRQRKR
jgi:hypothetical protein